MTRGLIGRVFLGVWLGCATAPAASAEVLYDREGIQLQGSAGIVSRNAATCNVLEEKHSDEEYERLKANQGRPLHVWQLDISAHNNTGKPLDFLSARFNIESPYPPCSNWSGPTGSFYDAEGHPEPVSWHGTLEVLYRLRMEIGEVERDRAFLLVFDTQEPVFRDWSVDFTFARPRSRAQQAPAEVPSTQVARREAHSRRMQLPPDILADKYLRQAEQLVQEGDHAGARAAMEELLSLQPEHVLEASAEDHFRYAQVWSAAGVPSRAIEAAVRYLQLEGREAAHYEEALDLVNRAEARQARGEAGSAEPGGARPATSRIRVAEFEDGKRITGSGQTQSQAETTSAGEGGFCGLPISAETFIVVNQEWRSRTGDRSMWYACNPSVSGAATAGGGCNYLSSSDKSLAGYMAEAARQAREIYESLDGGKPYCTITRTRPHHETSRPVRTTLTLYRIPKNTSAGYHLGSNGQRDAAKFFDLPFDADFTRGNTASVHSPTPTGAKGSSSEFDQALRNLEDSCGERYRSAFSEQDHGRFYCLDAFARHCALKKGHNQQQLDALRHDFEVLRSQGQESRCPYFGVLGGTYAPGSEREAVDRAEKEAGKARQEEQRRLDEQARQAAQERKRRIEENNARVLASDCDCISKDEREGKLTCLDGFVGLTESTCNFRFRRR